MKKNPKKVAKPELKDVPEKLRKIRWRLHIFPDEILEFLGYMADIAESKMEYNRNFIDETMIFLIDDARKCIKATQIGIKLEGEVPVPEDLKTVGIDFDKKIFYLILVVDEIASEEFSKGFRNLFIRYFSK